MRCSVIKRWIRIAEFREPIEYPPVIQAKPEPVTDALQVEMNYLDVLGMEAEVFLRAVSDGFAEPSGRLEMLEHEPPIEGGCELHRRLLKLRRPGATCPPNSRHLRHERHGVVNVDRCIRMVELADRRLHDGRLPET